MQKLFGWMNKGGHNAQSDVTAEEVQRRQAGGENLLILDVREPNEYKEAHVPGSMLVPLGQLAYKVAELPKDRPIVAICRSGNRSGVATNMLLRAGFNEVQNLSGGIMAWARAGGPLKRGN
ncbi:MAG: rhodanese-like domain-containing protein [Chloroflexota bacterium]